MELRTQCHICGRANCAWRTQAPCLRKPFLMCSLPQIYCNFYFGEHKSDAELTTLILSRVFVTSNSPFSTFNLTQNGSRLNLKCIHLFYIHSACDILWLHFYLYLTFSCNCVCVCICAHPFRALCCKVASAGAWAARCGGALRVLEPVRLTLIILMEVMVTVMMVRQATAVWWWQWWWWSVVGGVLPQLLNLNSWVVTLWI